MLRNFRSVIKADPKIVGLVMGVVALSMVIFLGQGFTSRGGEAVVARVYGREISLGDVFRQSKVFEQRMAGRGGQLPSTLFRSYAVQFLVQAKIEDELAARHGILVGDSEVRIALEQMLRAASAQQPILAQFFGSDGHLKPLPELETFFQPGAARGWFRERETEAKEQLVKMKLRRQLAMEVPVDAAWLESEHRFREEKLDIELLTLPVDTTGLNDPGDAALQAYLQQSGTRFQEGPRRALQVAIAEPASFDLKLSEAEVKAEFEAKKGRYARPADAEVKARHILFMAKTPAEYIAATKKAEALRAELMKGRDFEKAAEEVSEDPSAKGNGGDLGWFSRDKMVPEFSAAAFGMEVGDISQPVHTSYGIHLIKLEDAKPKGLLALDAVKDRVRTDLLQTRFEQKAKERMEELKKRAGGGDLSNGARALGLKLLAPTPISREATGIEGLDLSQGLVGEAFNLKVGEVGQVTPLGGKLVLLRVQQELPVAVPALKEIRAKVLKAWQRDEARKRLLAKVQDGLKGGDLKALGTPRVETAKAPRDLPNAMDPAIRKALLGTAAGQLTPILWTPDGQLWVARIQARAAAPALAFETRRRLMEEIQGQEAEKRYNAELRSLKAEGEKHSGFSSLWGRLNGIYLDEKMLKQLGGDEE